MVWRLSLLLLVCDFDGLDTIVHTRIYLTLFNNHTPRDTLLSLHFSLFSSSSRGGILTMVREITQYAAQDAYKDDEVRLCFATRSVGN